jgi:hypothetical protein
VIDVCFGKRAQHHVEFLHVVSYAAKREIRVSRSKPGSWRGGPEFGQAGRRAVTVQYFYLFNVIKEGTSPIQFYL